VGEHRGRRVGQAYRWLEALAALRYWSMAAIRRDVAGRGYWSMAARAFLRPGVVEPAVFVGPDAPRAS